MGADISVSVDTNQYKCSRGFLIERQDDGKFTPFFVKVRAIDVIDDEGYPLFPNGNINIDGMVHITEKNGWIIRNYVDNFYEATKTIEVTPQYFEKKSGTDSELFGVINLPKPVYEDSLDVGLTIRSGHDTIMTSFVSYVPTIVDGKVTAIRIALRNLTYTYANDWYMDGELTESKVNVRVSGH